MSAAVADEVVSKGAFAALCSVSPGRVSQWLAAGQIGPEALVGTGRNARIRVDVAKAQLRGRLDTDQRFGANGVATRLGDEPSLQAPAPSPSPVLPALDRQIQEEKLREIRYRNQAQAEAELARRGIYVRADEVRAGYARIASGMMSVMEGALADLASATAARFGLQQRDVLHLLRAEFRQVRAKAAEQMRRDAEKLPALVADGETTLDPDPDA